jgi:aspartate-semialdehyde dehydrogenase
LLANAPGVVLLEDNAEFPTQVSHAQGQDDVFVGRIRQDISHENGINLWVVADNVRKGAATNSIQIAEHLIRDYL